MKKRRTKNTDSLEAQARVMTSQSEKDIDLSDVPEMLNWDEAERAKFYRPTKQDALDPPAEEKIDD